MELSEIYDLRIESIHDFQENNGDMLQYFIREGARINAYLVTLGENQYVVSIEAIFKRKEWITFDGVDAYSFRALIGKTYEDLEITDPLMKSTLRLMWDHSESLQDGSPKRAAGIHFMNAGKKIRT